MKVVLLVPLASATGSYNAGDEYTCASPEEAQRMVSAGVAELVRAKPVEKAVRRSRAEKASK